MGITTAAVCKKLGVAQTKGLSEEEVKERLEKYGPNGKWSLSQCSFTTRAVHVRARTLLPHTELACIAEECCGSVELVRTV